jgi:hypothetical protein
VQDSYTAESPDQRINEIKIFDLVTDTDLEVLEQKLGAPNIFELVGLSSSEIRHSSFLKNLLDPSSSLGIGDRFLRFFLRHILISNQVEEDYGIGLLELELADLNDCTVYREYKNIDLLIEIKTNSKQFCVCIENKVFAGESENQLKKYRAIVNNEFGTHKKLFIFLTPNGDAAKNDQGWYSVSYQLVVNAVEHILSTTELGVEQRLLLEHYKLLLEKYVTNNLELINLANQLYKRHRDAFDFVFEHKEDQVSEINRRLKDWINSGDHQLPISLTVSTKTYVRFTTPEMRRVSDKYQGKGWGGSKETLLAEIQLTRSSVKIAFVIGPTINEDDRSNLATALWLKSTEKKGAANYYQIASKKIMDDKLLGESEELDKLMNELTERIKEWFKKETPLLNEKIDQLLA